MQKLRGFFVCLVVLVSIGFFSCDEDDSTAPNLEALTTEDLATISEPVDGTEITSLRTSHSRTYKMPDGKYMARFVTTSSESPGNFIESSVSNFGSTLRATLKYLDNSSVVFQPDASNNVGLYPNYFPDPPYTNKTGETIRASAQFDLDAIPDLAVIDKATVTIITGWPAGGAYNAGTQGDFEMRHFTRFDEVGTAQHWFDCGSGTIYHTFNAYVGQVISKQFTGGSFINTIQSSLFADKFGFGLNAKNDASGFPTVQTLNRVLSVTMDVWYEAENASITVTGPVSTDMFTYGGFVEIDWIAEGPLQNANVYYSSNNGSTWSLIGSNISHNGGPGGIGWFVWQNPNTVSASSKIKVVDAVYSDYFDTSPTFVIGPSLSISGPSSLFKGQHGVWSVSANPSGPYTYKWYKRTGPFGNWNYVSSGSSYSSTLFSSFELKVEAYSGSTLMSATTKDVGCANCGGIDP